MASGFVRSAQVRAAAEPQKITPELIEAAKKEGKVSWYTSVDLPVAEKIAKAFEANYPGVSMKVERSGAERNFQRIGQEYASKIYNCDVVNSSDAAHLIIWKRAEDAGLVPAGGRGASTFPRSTGIPTACTPRGASRSRRSPTTPSW